MVFFTPMLASNAQDVVINYIDKQENGDRYVDIPPKTKSTMLQKREN